MAAESGQFRGALGGFNRRDVAQYIEKAAGEHREQMEALRAELEQTRQARDTLAEELEGMRSRNGDLAEQEAQSRARLEESDRSLSELRAELEQTQGQLSAAKQQLSDLQAKVEELERTQGQLSAAKQQLSDLQTKVAELEPLARRYEGLKDRVATVELEAHQKAQEIVSAADAQTRVIRQEAGAWVAELSGSYQALRAQLSAFVSQAEQTSLVFEQGKEAYQELLRRVGQSGEEGSA